jgi:hypothetical protein
MSDKEIFNEIVEKKAKEVKVKKLKEKKPVEKKKKKTAEMTDERRAMLLENLKRGREKSAETRRKNKEAKAILKKDKVDHIEKIIKEDKAKQIKVNEVEPIKVNEVEPIKVNEVEPIKVKEVIKKIQPINTSIFTPTKNDNEYASLQDEINRLKEMINTRLSPMVELPPIKVNMIPKKEPEPVKQQEDNDVLNSLRSYRKKMEAQPIHNEVIKPDDYNAYYNRLTRGEKVRKSGKDLANSWNEMKTNKDIYTGSFKFPSYD